MIQFKEQLWGCVALVDEEREECNELKRAGCCLLRFSVVSLVGGPLNVTQQDGSACISQLVQKQHLVIPFPIHTSGKIPKSLCSRFSVLFYRTCKCIP